MDPVYEMTQEDANRVFHGMDLEELCKNLKAILKEYGATDETIYSLAYESGAYFRLLDEKTGKLSEEGRESMEHWKYRFGNQVDEMQFDMWIIGD